MFKLALFLYKKKQHLLVFTKNLINFVMKIRIDILRNTTDW